LVGGTDELIAMLRDVEDLKAGQPSSVPEFFGFENWQQVVEFVRSGEGEELLTFVNLVEARGERQLLWALNQVADEDDCDFVVSTAHKAKGREWPEVRLMDDFLKSLPKKERGQTTSEIDPSELRLLYVAITRAKDTIEVPSSLMQFLNTGSLPRAVETQSTFVSSRPRRPVTSAGTRTLSPPQWTPPTNWRQSSESTAQIGQPEPVANTHTARPPPPSPSTPAPLTKKVGLFRRLFGR
jgi:ATP-dependent exoDNAse (exonuclease V) beta subunit